MNSSAKEMMGWIETICARGIRRPGYPADVETTDWALQLFRDFDLQDVRLEPVVLPKWEPKSWSLRIGDEEFECYPVPNSSAGDVEGALGEEIALERVALTRFWQSTARDLAMRHYDPTNEFDTLSQTLPFSRQIQNVMEPAIEAGAKGFVGIFDAPWESCEYYVPYDAIERPIPGVYVSRSTGERLQALLPATAHLTVDSTREDITTHNVIGTLPGASDEWVIVGSHHDGPWVSAVEDASGVALVLAQAKYWASVAQDERPHNMLFLLTSGHMCHGAGTAAFIAAHNDFLREVVLEVHLEHPARECKGIDGKLVPTDDPEVRWWFTSKNDALIDAVEEAIKAEDLTRSLIMPPEVFGPSPTTDGGFFHLEGVPLVNFLCAPMYLFDGQDTVDKIHVDSLEPVTRAAIRILESTKGRTAAELRS